MVLFPTNFVMTEFFDNLIPAAAELPDAKLVARLVQATLLGIAVAAVYYTTQKKKRSKAAPLVATLVLLSVLIAMVTKVVGENVARAFSLAGALAIIRFRTVVNDTRDTAFVIAAVVTGMAVGAESIAVALAGVPVVAVTAWLLHAWGRGNGGNGKREPGSLAVRLGPAATPEAVLAEPFARLLDAHDLQAAATARQGGALDLTYSALIKPSVSPATLVAELTRLEGVQNVEWKNG
jgi:hypothetical protein